MRSASFFNSSPLKQDDWAMSVGMPPGDQRSGAPEESHTNAFRCGCPTSRHAYVRAAVLFGADGVADRRPNLEQVIRGKVVGVVVYVVVTRFRPDEEVAPHVVANADSSINQEVIRSVVVDASAEVATRIAAGIEACALPSGAGKQIGAKFLSKSGLVNAVEVPQNRTIRLTASAAVTSLAGAPVHVKTDTNSAMEDHICTHAGVKAAAFRAGGAELRGKGKRASVVVRRHQRAEVEHGIALLGECGTRE